MVSTSGGVTGDHDRISTLGVFPIPSNSANAGVDVAVNTTTGRVTILPSSYAVNSTSTEYTSTLLENTENGDNIVLSLVFEKFSGNFGKLRATSSGTITGTFRLNIGTTCGTIVGPARNAVLAIVEGTSRTTAGTTRARRGPLRISFRTLGTTGRTLTRAPRLLPILGRTNIISTNNDKLILVFRNVRDI